MDGFLECSDVLHLLESLACPSDFLDLAEPFEFIDFESPDFLLELNDLLLDAMDSSSS